MTLLRFVVVLFIMVSSVVSSFADDEAFDFFVETCRHSGYNPVEISTFQAVLTIETKTAWPDWQVESIINRMRKRHEDLGLSDERRQDREEFLERFRQHLSDSTSTNTKKVLVRNTASIVGLADANAHIVIENQTDGISTFFYQGAKEQLSATQFGEDSVMIQGKVQEPTMYHLEGRMGTPRARLYMRFLLSDNGEGGFDITDAGIAAFKKDCEARHRTFILSKEKEQYAENHFASILEVYEKGEIQDRFWIDSDRGYICPRAQMLWVDSSNGTITLHDEIISENFVLDEPSQKWFPTKIIRVLGKDQEERTGKPEQYEEINVVPETLILNQPIPDSAFAIQVHQGRRVDDTRGDSTNVSTFFANQTGTLDLPTVEEKSLDELGWLTPREVGQPQEPYLIEEASFNWVNVVFLALGVIMIILGLIILFYKKSGTDI